MLLLVCGVATAAPARKFNGGLEASVISAGRSQDAKYLTVTVLIKNAGTNTAYLMLIGPTSANDSSGGSYTSEDISGIPVCPWHGSTNQCIDAFQNDSSHSVQKLSQVDPGTDFMITFKLKASRQNQFGATIDFATTLAARFVSDPVRDETLRDDMKGRQVRPMNLSFPGEPVTNAR